MMKTKIKLMSININGIRGKILELQSFIEGENPDVLAIQETKIDKSIQTAELFLDILNYDVYRNDRTLHGGGVMLLVNKSLNAMPLYIFENGSESVWAKATFNGSSHYFGCWYKDPESPIENIKLLREQLSKIQTQSPKNKIPNIHLLGNFNFPSIDWDTKTGKNGKVLSQTDGQAFVDILNDHHIEQLIDFPTRGENVLDLMLTTLPSQICDINSPDKLSDHEVISCNLCVFTKPTKTVKCKFYLYNKGNYTKMKDETRTFNRDIYFNGLQNNSSTEENWKILKTFIQKTVNDNVPSKISRSRKQLPWISQNIRAKIRRRNKLHKRAKETGSKRLKAKWEELRKDIKKEINTAHNRYIEDMIGNIKENSKPFWKYISSQKKDTQSIPPLKTKSGNTAENDSDKAEVLNEQFSSVFTPKSETDEIPYIKKAYQNMKDIKVTEDGIRKLLHGLNTSKACGPDEISPKILKELANKLAPTITHLFQQSIDKGAIPEEWTTANICPLFKKSDRSIPANYRPVSLTCILCKLCEHIVCSNIMNHLERNKIITNRQHAFRKHHSCETQLSNVTHDWAKNIDDGKQTDIFILDFEKAFDTVPHEKLKSKLNGYGISGKTLNWIDAFLCHRRQCVVVKGTKSKWSTVESGVPQGTVLGPVLFSLHINDILDDIDSEIRLFADDCVCYRIINSINDCQKLQQDIDRLGAWARKWGMRFQPVKCNMMKLTRKKKHHIDFDYKLEGTSLKFLDTIKYLGVHISSDLRWEKHVSEVTSKANRVLGMLKRNLHFCNKEAKETAYLSLIRPILEYAGTVWDPNCKYLEDELEKVQKRAARFTVNNYTYEEGSMTQIMEELKWKSLKERRKENRLILFHKGLNGLANIPTSDVIPNTRKNRNKHEKQFYIPFARTDTFKHSFIPQTIRDWNKLDPAILQRTTESVDECSIFSETIRSTRID